MDIKYEQLTNNTKKACTCSALSIFLIVLFILTPLSSFIITSVFVKLLVICLLIYTIYLNYLQGIHLKNMRQDNISNEIYSQLNMNIICNYVFSLFMGLLIFFVLKTFI